MTSIATKRLTYARVLHSESVGSSQRESGYVVFETQLSGRHRARETASRDTVQLMVLSAQQDPELTSGRTRSQPPQVPAALVSHPWLVQTTVTSLIGAQLRLGVRIVLKLPLHLTVAVVQVAFLAIIVMVFIFSVQEVLSARRG
jgi:hypothetical protein